MDIETYRLLEDLRYRAKSKITQKQWLDPEEVLANILAIYFNEEVAPGGFEASTGNAMEADEQVEKEQPYAT